MNGRWEEVIEPIQALRKELPSTKTGFIRRALPQIEEALAQGHSLKKIWLRFREAGFDVKYKHFCTYVTRVRRERVRSATSKIDNSRHLVAGEAPVAQERAEVVKRDPFANLRRVEAERTVFNYRGTQDLEELVYGKRKRDKEQ